MFFSNRVRFPLLLLNSMPLTVRLCLVVLSALFLLLCSSTSCLGNQYDKCLRDTSTCDDIEFGYPFGKNGSGCGDPEFQLLSCDYESHILINIGGDEYHILESSFLVNSSRYKILRIVNDKLWGGKCNLSGNYRQFWWSASHFQMLDGYTNLTLWKQCDDPISDDIHGSHGQNLISLCGDHWHYSLNPNLDLERRPFCNAFQLPIKKRRSSFQINSQVLQREGFEVTWQVDPNRYQSCEDCLNTKGTCGYNISKPTTFLCYCPDGSSHPGKCADNGTEDTEDRNMSAFAIGCLVVGITVTAIALAVTVFLTYDACKRKNPPPPQVLKGNENYMANPPYSSSVPESPSFTSTENSSMSSESRV